MDMFKDYNAYKQYRPQYATWKEKREKQEAKRLAYLEKHPELKTKKEIERGQTILQAIDVLDEYSQSKAENMEVTTELLSQNILGAIALVGQMAGFAAIYKIKPLRAQFDKMAKTNKMLSVVASLVPMAIGGTIASCAAFPIMAWAAKAETGASRKGRLEAMQTKLQNPAYFATLTDEQKQKLQEKTTEIKLSKEEEKLQTPKFSFKESLELIKNIHKQDEIEQKEQETFKKLIDDFDKNEAGELKGAALENAKRDQQILTKLVEKIDLASQDYAEDVEFAMNTLSIFSLLTSVAIGWLGSKLNDALKIGQNSKIAKAAPWAIGLAGGLALASYSASVQKQASRVGRFNIKQELAKTPEQLIYIDDEKINKELDEKITLKPSQKQNLVKFLWQAFQDNKKYKQYQKTKGLEDKKRIKALEKIELSAEQEKEAKILQRNTFKTFNKVDEMSQKYAESVEARGNSFKEPLQHACQMIGMLIGFRYLTKIPAAIKNSNNKITNFNELIKGYAKYVTACCVSFLPVVGYDYQITKQQKEATRVANMLAINELSDIKNYKGYAPKNTNFTQDKIDEKKTLG